MFSVEISIVQAMKLKNKSTIPAYLSYCDEDFPDTSLLPFLQKFNETLKEMVNEETWRQFSHGMHCNFSGLQYLTVLFIL